MSGDQIPLGSGERFAIMASGERKYSRANFAGNFKRLLGVHALTAAETSKLVGISTTTLSYWLNGERDPSLSSLEKVCAFFEVDAFKLLGQWTGSFLMEELADLERWGRVEAKLKERPPAVQIAKSLVEPGEKVRPLKKGKSAR